MTRNDDALPDMNVLAKAEDMRLYVGIDPGKTGAIAWLQMRKRGGNHVWLRSCCGSRKMPAERVELFRLIEALESPYTSFTVEAVHSMPRDGVVSAFTFGQGFGSLMMALDVLTEGVTMISPAVWQRAIGCMSGGDKGKLWAFAEKKFPGKKIYKYEADAYLLAMLGSHITECVNPT